jgi:hypothetical protein
MDDRNLFAGVAGIAPQKIKIREEEGRYTICAAVEVLEQSPSMILRLPFSSVTRYLLDFIKIFLMKI